MQGSGNIDHRLNRLHAGQQIEIEFLLDMNKSLGIHREPLALIESLHDLARRTPAPMIVEILREFCPVWFKSDLPGFKMQPHRVSKRAVAVEDVGGELAPGKLKSNHAPFLLTGRFAFDEKKTGHHSNSSLFPRSFQSQRKEKFHPCDIPSPSSSKTNSAS